MEPCIEHHKCELSDQPTVKPQTIFIKAHGDARDAGCQIGGIGKKPKHCVGKSVMYVNLEVWITMIVDIQI